MADVNMEKAKQVYEAIIAMLDKRNWSYDRHDEDLVISSGVKGDDLPINFLLVVNAKNQVVSFLSRLPFSMSEEKLVDGAIACCIANNRLVDGSFDYDVTNGNITFRLTTCYRDSDISESVFEYMIMVASMTVDNYNDKFLMISKGMMSVDQLLNN